MAREAFPPRPSDEVRYSQSLERGLALLAAFEGRGPLLGISELARAVGLGRSTAHRYVATLAHLGYLEQDPETRKYGLGLRTLDLGFSVINGMGLPDLAQPYIKRLGDRTGYMSSLSVLDRDEIVYLVCARSSQHRPHEIDLNLHVGSRLPAYCTSMGKVLLAGMPTNKQRQLVRRMQLTPRGRNTITTVPALLAELTRIRAEGLAVNDEELAFGLRSIAVPVQDRRGDVVAAVNLSVHRSLMSREEMVAQLSPALKDTGSKISSRLGFRPSDSLARSPA